jgi:hypothetical protein
MSKHILIICFGVFQTVTLWSKPYSCRLKTKKALQMQGFSVAPEAGIEPAT